MTLGCEHSPSVSGGVARRKSRQKMASRGWERDRELRTRVASVVANASREVEPRVDSRTGVAKVGCECESRKWVANVSREMGSRMCVAKWGRECGSRNKKIGAYVNEGPERLGPFFKRSVP